MGIAIISIVTTLVYLNSLRVPFTLDDVSGIINNPSTHLDQLSLSELNKAISNSRPVSNLSLALNYYFNGFNVVGYHVVNIMIHCLTAIVVYIFFLKILPSSSSLFALLGSLLWAVHPVHIQAVTYIIQRMTGLATLFFMLSLVLYIQGRETGGAKRIWLFLLALGAGLLGVSSKEIAVTLPFVILLYEFYFRAHCNPHFLKRQLKYWVPFFVMTLLFLAGYFTNRGGLIHGLQNILTMDFGNESITGYERLLTESRVIIFYLSLLILPLPSRLNLDHDFAVSTSLLDPLSTLFSVIFILGLILYSLWIAKKYPVVSFGILWFGINLALESTIIKLDIIFEHRLYLPSIGIFLLLSWTLMKISQPHIAASTGRIHDTNPRDTISNRIQVEPRSWGYGSLNLPRSAVARMKHKMIVQPGILLLTLGVLGFYSVATFLRNAVWQDSITLWTDIVKKSPNKARAHSNLGALYFDRGDLDLAEQEFEQALRLRPEGFVYRDNLAVVYQREGKIADAIRLYQDALKFNPYDAAVYQKLGKIYFKDGRQDLATIAFEKSITLDPGQAMTYSLLGQVYHKSGYAEKAAMAYEEALRLIKNKDFKPRIRHSLIQPEESPDKPSLHYQLGQIYEELERPAVAIQHYQAAIAELPVFLPARMRLLLLYKKTGRMDLAEAEYRRIMEEDPAFTIAQDGQGRAILPK